MEKPIILSWAMSVDLSPFIRYDISRIKMKANDILTSSETTTDEAIALGIDISKTGNYEEGQLPFLFQKYLQKYIQADWLICAEGF
jgi:hypothetical protein